MVKYFILGLFLVVCLLAIYQVMRFIIASTIGSERAKDYSKEAVTLASKLKGYQDEIRSEDRINGDDSSRNVRDVKILNTLKNLVYPTIQVRMNLLRHETILRNHNYKNFKSYIILRYNLRKARKMVSELEFVSKVWGE